MPADRKLKNDKMIGNKKDNFKELRMKLAILEIFWFSF